MKPPSKEELLKDPARILFERYYRALVGYFCRLGFSQDEARDLAQDVFIRVLPRMKSFRGEGAWSFLQTTARNLALNKIRHENTKKIKADKVSLETQPFLSESVARDLWSGQIPPSPEDELIEREERKRQSRRLREAIEELPSKPQTCLLLWLRGLKFREIQDTLGITMDAVKSRLNEARNHLRAKLKEEPEGLDWPAVTPEVNRDQKV